MRTASSRSSDFNQTLVVSVFIHLSLFTILMFVPRPKAFPKLIVPVFNVDLVEIPSAKPAPAGQASGPPSSPPQHEGGPAEAVETPEAKAPVPPLNPVEKPAEKAPVPAAPEKPAAKPEPTPHEPLLEELEQLAKAPPPAPQKAALPKPPSKLHQAREKIDLLKNAKPAPLPKPVSKAEPKPAPLPKSASVTEDTLRETEAKKHKSALPDMAVPEAVLAGLDKVAKETPSSPEKTFEELAQKEMKEAKKKQYIETAELLSELKKMSPVTEEFKTQAPPEKPKEAVSEKPEKSIDKIKEKLAELGKTGKSVAVNIDIESGKKAQPEKFTSSIRSSDAKPSAGVPSTGSGLSAAVSKDASVSSASGQARSEAAADVLSVYVSKIREKIYANWKIPLGTEYSKRIVVAFYLFPGGNIDKPTLKDSSGAERLDSLAIRAIADSAPFPKFPEELREANLHITIHFKLTPSP